MASFSNYSNWIKKTEEKLQDYINYKEQRFKQIDDAVEGDAPQREEGVKAQKFITALYREDYAIRGYSKKNYTLIKTNYFGTSSKTVEDIQEVVDAGFNADLGIFREATFDPPPALLAVAFLPFGLMALLFWKAATELLYKRSGNLFYHTLKNWDDPNDRKNQSPADYDKNKSVGNRHAEFDMFEPDSYGRLDGYMGEMSLVRGLNLATTEYLTFPTTTPPGVFTYTSGILEGETSQPSPKRENPAGGIEEHGEYGWVEFGKEPEDPLETNYIPQLLNIFSANKLLIGTKSGVDFLFKIEEVEEANRIVPEPRTNPAWDTWEDDILDLLANKPLGGGSGWGTWETNLNILLVARPLGTSSTWQDWKDDLDDLLALMPNETEESWTEWNNSMNNLTSSFPSATIMVDITYYRRKFKVKELLFNNKMKTTGPYDLTLLNLNTQKFKDLLIHNIQKVKVKANEGRMAISFNEEQTGDCKIAYSKYNELIKDLDIWLKDTDNFTTEKMSNLSTLFQTRLNYLQVRAQQIKRLLVPSLYNTRKEMFYQRLHKQDGSLFRVFRASNIEEGTRIKTSTRLAELRGMRNVASFIYKKVVESGKGEFYAIVDKIPEDESYMFKVGDVVYVGYAEVEIMPESFKITKITTEKRDGGVDDDGNILKKDVYKLELNKKFSKEYTVDKEIYLIKEK